MISKRGFHRSLVSTYSIDIFFSYIDFVLNFRHSPTLAEALTVTMTKQISTFYNIFLLFTKFVLPLNQGYFETLLLSTLIILSSGG